jgi:hypothetical protein
VGAEVFVDDARKDSVPAPGRFILSLDPGTHSINLRKPNFTHRQVTKQFNAGETVKLTPEDLVLRPTQGIFEITVDPTNGLVRYRASSGQEWILAQGRGTPGRFEVQVQAGKYDFQASADGYITETQTSSVAGGARTPVPFNLKPSVVIHGLDSWDTLGQQSRWLPDKDRGRDWSKLKGARNENFVVYRVGPATGFFSFVWDKRGTGFIFGSGKGQSLKWAVGFLDEKNYIYFTFDGKRLVHQVLADGTQDLKNQREVPVQDGGNIFSVRITITQDRVDTEIWDQGNQRRLATDSLAGLGRYLVTGSFAFDVRNEEEVWLQSFRFEQRR